MPTSRSQGIAQHRHRRQQQQAAQTYSFPIAALFLHGPLQEWQGWGSFPLH